MRLRIKSLLPVGGLLLLYACTPEMPLPRAYFRIALPPKTYAWSDSLKPYCFEYARSQSRILPRKEDSLWFDISYPRYHARIYCSYLPVHGNFYEISEDSRTFVYKHTSKADAIIGQVYEDPARQMYGILYVIKGNAASPVQFVLTDSTCHFLRGALYFNNRPNKDSLAPVIRYIQDDIEHLMETAQWKTTCR